MPRTLLLIAAVVWSLAGAVGLVVAAAGTEALFALLPLLAIDRQALGGAITAVSLAALGVGIVHAAILVGIRAGRRWATSAGTLLASILVAAFVATAAAALASAVRTPELTAPLIGGAVLALLFAAAYLAAAVGLVRELGSGSAS